MPAEISRLVSATQMYAEYAHRVDDGRIGAWSALFAPDGVMAVRGKEYVGPQGIYNYLAANRTDGEPSAARHLITNVRADVDGDTARLRADFTHLRVARGAAVTEMVGAYNSTLIWVNSEWKFSRHEVSFLLDLPQNSPS